MGGFCMQKIFIRYTFAIMTAAILLTFFINFLFTLRSLESQQFNTFHTKTDQIIHTLEMNQEELAIIRENLDEDYLTRAKAAAYVLAREDELSLNVGEMKYLANLLNVDEVHVIDENGIIVAGSVSQYIGIDMANHKQTRPFLSLLESDDENAYLIQDSQPNAAENKVMQYVGVVRKVKKGIVQVGFKPTRQMEAQARNTYDSIFTLFPADIGEEFFIIDNTTGTILGHSGGLNQRFNEECYQLEQLRGCAQGAYRKGPQNQTMYLTSTSYENKLICAALPRKILFEKLWEQISTTFLYLLFIEVVVLLLLNHLVRRKAVDGIHQIIENLTSITNGHLDTEVNVGGNREFQELSRRINTMVKSIVTSTDRISAIIEISGVPLAAFEYELGLNHVFQTSGLKELLAIPEQMAERFFSNSVLFDRYIREIMTAPIPGETDIFHIRESRYVRIHISESSGKHLGVVMDVSSDIQKKQQLHYENTHDSLTGLCKFPYFKQLASEILENMPKDQICAAVMLDLDYFKSINDTYGHDVGDTYLQSFSAVMQSMPEEHFLTARRSGDEFCMMIFGCCSREEIISHLDRFYEALQNHPAPLGPNQSKIISASCGFAQTSDSFSSIHQLLSQADEALYDIKRHTKGRYGEYGK